MSNPKCGNEGADLRCRAEARLCVRPGNRRSGAGDQKLAVDSQRLLHELQVHQVELEMQNAEIQESRGRMEAMLEKYTDLYDFAPVGYLSLDEQGLITEVNLTGAGMLGVERARLLRQPLQHYMDPTSRPVFLALLKSSFSGGNKQVGEVALLGREGNPFWADLQIAPEVLLGNLGKRCRAAFTDITALKRADEAQRRMQALAVTNRQLRLEIARRRKVEAALLKSEQHQIHLQERLRHLSHHVLRAQEAERKRISRELHDEICQTLVGINVHLETLAREAKVNPLGLKKRISRTQRLVEKSVNIVHRFARELRPPLLDDFGLVASVHSLLKDFTKQTGIRVHFNAFTGVEKLSSDQQTVLYRVAHSALANVARHAQATWVKVSILKQSDAVCMEITDNGQAFDAEKKLRAKGNKCLGLLGMRERLEMVGGKLSVRSMPGKGTTIQAHLSNVFRH